MKEKLMAEEQKKMWITSAQQWNLSSLKWRDKLIAEFSPENQQAIHRLLDQARDGTWAEGKFFRQAGEREGGRNWFNIPRVGFPMPTTVWGAAEGIAYVSGIAVTLEDKIAELSAELEETKKASREVKS